MIEKRSSKVSDGIGDYGGGKVIVNKVMFVNINIKAVPFALNRK